LYYIVCKEQAQNKEESPSDVNPMSFILEVVTSSRAPAHVVLLYVEEINSCRDGQCKRSNEQWDEMAQDSISLRFVCHSSGTVDIGIVGLSGDLLSITRLLGVYLPDDLLLYDLRAG